MPALVWVPTKMMGFLPSLRHAGASLTIGDGRAPPDRSELGELCSMFTPRFLGFSHSSMMT